MGRLVCPSCGREFDASVLFCPDDNVQLVEQSEATDIQRTIVVPPASEPEDGATRMCPTPGCNQSLGAHDHVCPMCGAFVAPTTQTQPALNSVILRLPNGMTEPLAFDTQILLGRMSPVPAVAQALLPFSQTSRKHALLWIADGRLHVKDEGSLGGTWLDGEKVTDYASAPLSNNGHIVEIPQGIICRIEAGGNNE